MWTALKAKPADGPSMEGELALDKRSSSVHDLQRYTEDAVIMSER